MLAAHRRCRGPAATLRQRVAGHTAIRAAAATRCDTAAVRVLLSDGSSLAARQTALQLAKGGHTVGVAAADRWCLTRFTRHVKGFHRVPAFGADPYAWLDATLKVAADKRYEVIFPTQEQVAVLSSVPGRLADAGVATAVPSFDALVQVQDKLSAFATLARVGLPQPPTAVVTGPAALREWDEFPAFVKTPIGTARAGVRRVAGGDELARAADDLEASGAFALGGVLVQREVLGPLLMVQSVFCEGELVAVHANLRLREGVDGGASHKESLELPEIREHLATLGGALGWHGALSADAIVSDVGLMYIDVNPRLVEPANAWHAGVDLVAIMVNLARGITPASHPAGHNGIRTHQLLLAVLGAAQSTGRRRAVLGELRQAAARHGSYARSAEELTPLAGDWRSVVPVAAAATATLVRPRAWRSFATGAVAGYSLSPTGWQAILDRGRTGTAATGLPAAGGPEGATAEPAGSAEGTEDQAPRDAVTPPVAPQTAGAVGAAGTAAVAPSRRERRAGRGAEPAPAADEEQTGVGSATEPDRPGDVEPPAADDGAGDTPPAGDAAPGAVDATATGRTARRARRRDRRAGGQHDQTEPPADAPAPDAPSEEGPAEAESTGSPASGSDEPAGAPAAAAGAGRVPRRQRRRERRGGDRSGDETAEDKTAGPEEEGPDDEPVVGADSAPAATEAGAPEGSRHAATRRPATPPGDPPSGGEGSP